jgi:hypothetical protein
MFTGIEVSLSDMLPYEQFQPDPSYSPMILALVTEGDDYRPVTLFWSGKRWIHENGNARDIVRWVYITMQEAR